MNPTKKNNDYKKVYIYINNKKMEYIYYKNYMFILNKITIYTNSFLPQIIFDIYEIYFINFKNIDHAYYQKKDYFIVIKK